MDDEHLDKAARRAQVISERRRRLLLASSEVPDAVCGPAPDLALAPGLDSVLPSAGEWVAAYLSLADEPPTGGLLRLLAAREIKVLVPAPGPARRTPARAQAEAATEQETRLRPGGSPGLGRRAVAWAQVEEQKPVRPGGSPGPATRAVAWAQVEAATCALPAAPPGQLPEPAGPRLGEGALERCRLILAPALSVDRTGTRLGRGGGWYDRALVHAANGALVLAVCFPWEVLAQGALPRESHDVPVDGVLTGQGVNVF
ncbi:MAG: hypothetical protein LBS27_06435 [Bifidobacteriaceae bacterium]|nr:hypothetical protein [Bifidobacteriaceae bacterium]